VLSVPQELSSYVSTRRQLDVTVGFRRVFEIAETSININATFQVPDNKLSMALVILVPVLSALVGLSVDCCLCCHHLRRRRAAQHRISQVKQVVTMYTVLRRAVRIRRAPPVKADGSGENQTEGGNCHNGDDGSSSAGWLAKAVGAMVGIKRLAGSRKGKAPVANSGLHVAGDNGTADASFSADVTVLDQSEVSAAQQAGPVLSENRGAVLSPVVAWGGDLPSGGEITSVDSWRHSLDADETGDKVEVSGRPADTC